MRPSIKQNADPGQTWLKEDACDSFDTNLASDLSCSSMAEFPCMDPNSENQADRIDFRSQNTMRLEVII